VRRLGKVLGIIGIVLLVLVVVASAFGAWTVRRSFPQVSGEVALAGLTGSVEVRRDVRGIPHVYADTPDDLFFAQGYVHAQDRFWEMDFRRHITAGRLSEMFGSSQVETDTFLRISGWRRVAEQELPLLSAETRRNLDAYAKGVNAYLADHAGATASFEYAVLGLTNPSYTIEPWTTVDSIAWLKAMAWDLRGNMQEEISRSIISAKVGEARTVQLYPPYPTCGTGRSWCREPSATGCGTRTPAVRSRPRRCRACPRCPARRCRPSTRRAPRWPRSTRCSDRSGPGSGPTRGSSRATAPIPASRCSPTTRTSRR
jgi:penicillin amidase